VKNVKRALHFQSNLIVSGARGRVGGWGTALRAGRSIPDGVTGIVLGHNPSGRAMTLRSTQPLTEIFLGVKAAGA